MVFAFIVSFVESFQDPPSLVYQVEPGRNVQDSIKQCKTSNILSEPSEYFETAQKKCKRNDSSESKISLCSNMFKNDECSEIKSAESFSLKQSNNGLKNKYL